VVVNFSMDEFKNWYHVIACLEMAARKCESNLRAAQAMAFQQQAALAAQAEHDAALARKIMRSK